MTEQFNDLQAELSPAQDLSSDISADTPEVAASPEPSEPNGFVQLGLADELVKAVADLGYTQPTAVQSRTIPLALPADDEQHHGYNDLMVSSQTGSGKTAAFLLPVLHTLIQQLAAAEAKAKADHDQACADAIARGEEPPKRNRRKDPTNPRNFKAAVPGALVLCPTRELAQQVAHDAIELVKHCRGVRIANVVGGIPYQIQIAKLQNANLVVATPGRLLDLQRSMQIKLNEVQFLVVDEADRMLDLGFSDDLAEINQLTEQRRQTMMFSATFAPRIQQLAMRVMHDGGSGVHKVQIDSPQEKHANIKQVLFWADNAEHKRQLLDHWLRDASIDQAIVFASTQIECDGLATELQQAGFAAVALHGALSQGLRNRRLMALRSGQVQILVATDVAARGIDVPTITHVFNFGLPMKAEDYTHRIGRTGRAGRSGLAVTFAEIRDRRKIGDIEFYTKQPFKAEVIPGLEPKQRFDYPARKSFGGKGGGKGGRSNDRGFGGGPARGFGNRGGERFDGPGRGGDFRGGERFEPRFDARKDGGRQEPRFEARHDPRFEQGPAREGWSAPRGGPTRGEQDRAPRGFGQPNERFERRDDRAPRSFDKPQHAPRAQARAGGNDRFDRAPRGPKLVGGGFKPHAPKRRG
jgi:superfamily II DNA/RNA helicase